jgi:endonuclease/exonuclease/phosphatase family metal-dependent hydrolase
MLTAPKPFAAVIGDILAKLQCKLRRRGFLPSSLVAIFAAGLAILGTGCASYVPRSLVIQPSALPEVIAVGNGRTIDLRMISFNVWGLPVWMNGASQNRYSRIAQQLEELHPDFVLLQEVWTKQARASSPAGREWSMAWSSGQANFFKENGLLTISRHPILGGEFHPFRAAAVPDSLVKKGALKVTIELAEGFRLNVWNVHLQAGGADAVRSRQITELVSWVAATRDGQIADLVAGDFNCTPESEQYRVLSQQIGPSVQSISGKPGFTTFDGLSTSAVAGQILDHAFIRILTAIDGIEASPRAVFTAERITDRLSDHLGIEVALRFALSPQVGRGIETLASGPTPASVRFHPASP